MTENVVKQAFYRLRQRCRESLHEEIAQTVTVPPINAVTIFRVPPINPQLQILRAETVRTSARLNWKHSRLDQTSLDSAVNN